MGYSVGVVAVVLIQLLCSLVVLAEARSNPIFSILSSEEGQSAGIEKARPVRSTLELAYHSGPLLSGSSALGVNLVWYGSFTATQRSVILDFFASFQESPELHPSVSSWWKTTAAYKDYSNTGVKPSVQLVGEVSDAKCSLGKKLSKWEIEFLVRNSLGIFKPDSKAIYLVLTAEDVFVDGFCMHSCASHSFIPASALSQGHQLPYAWVGNSASQCPGQCAWPFALPQYGPLGARALIAPNGDVGVDGMIINIANMLAGTATDPYLNAFYQGDASMPLESATACAGIYAEGAYPGYPGNLPHDVISGATYNVEGINKRKFLLPALWDPVTRTCAPPS